MYGLSGIEIAFLDRFPMTCFITKVMPYRFNKYRTVTYVNILKTIKTCSTSHTGLIHMNALRSVHTHIHHGQKQFQETIYALAFVCLVCAELDRFTRSRWHYLKLCIHTLMLIGYMLLIRRVTEVYFLSQIVCV